MLAKEEEAKSQEWESEESVSDEEMTRRFVIQISLWPWNIGLICFLVS